MSAAIVLGVLILGIIMLVAFVAGMYNNLVTLRNRFENAFAQIDVQLKRRYDLIPNVVEVAKKYLAHERETLEAVIAARARAVNAEERAASQPGDAAAIRELGQAEAGLTMTLGKLFALSEAYPDLKADKTMAQLTEELTSTENRVAFARQAFNDAVMMYNTGRETFPANVVVAAPFNFAEAELLESTTSDAERVAPKVSFS